MLSVTDSTLIDVFPVVNPPANIDLTDALIDANLTDSNVINATVAGAVRTMLKSIVSNTNVSAITKSKIAQYVGFSINSKVSPAVTSFDKTKISIDKLTFYVMFRLPYSNGTKLTYDAINNGNTANAIAANTNSWGLYANYIRTLSGTNLKKLNDAGEQVNSSGMPVNDSNVPIDGWYSEAAYNFLDVFPFNTAVSVPSGFPSSSTEKAMLFGQNTEQFVSGETSLDITRIPLYFFLLAKVENPYNSGFWLNANKNAASRIPHWPATLTEIKYRKHWVKVSSNPSNQTISNGIYVLASDSGGTYFKINEKKIYITPLDNDALIFEGLTIAGANKVEQTDNGLVAIWESKYDHPSVSNNSGLTFGMGVDAGALFGGVYKIEFTITITGTGTFRLYYGASRTPALSTAITNSQLKTAIENLLEIKSNELNKDFVKVTTDNSGNRKLSIYRRASRRDQIDAKAKVSLSKYYFAYNHKIFAGDFKTGASVTFSPDKEADRWKENAEVVDDELFYFYKLLNYSFSNSEQADGYWLDQLGTLTSSQKLQIQTSIKKLFGCQGKAGYPVWDENRTLIAKVELKSYVRNLRAAYHKIFVEKFYKKQYTLKNGKSRKSTTAIESLIGSLKVKPNQAELLAITLLSYNFPSSFSAQKSKFITAINQHSLPKLRTALNGNRIDAFNKFVGSTVVTKLYHGIED